MMKRVAKLGFLMMIILLSGCNKESKFDLSLTNRKSIILADNSTPYHSKSYDYQNTKEVSLKLKSFAGDIAALSLITVKDEKGNILFEKFLANTHCVTLKFQAPVETKEIFVQYGERAKKTLILDKESKTYWDLTVYRM